MKKHALSFGLALAIGAIGAAPAHAQLGGLGKIASGAAKVKKLSDAKVSEAEERQIGQEVSDKVVETFGVYQDANVARYVTLVGAVMAQASARPDLDWQFVVLDTDGVNAFAAPGGFVHITKGLLGLLKTEAELAGALGHEIAHVTGKHTVNAIFKGNLVEAGSDEFGSGGMAQSLIAKVAQKAYSDILNNRFSRGDENDADEKGIALANKVGYAPNGLVSVLNKLVERNKSAAEPNGMFASHPQMKDRIANIEKEIRDKKLAATATVQARYAKYITFDAKPAASIATVAEGSRGLAGGEEKKGADAEKAEAKKEEPKKGGGFGSAFNKLRGGSSSENKQAQNISSGGARGINPDRDAVGGSNKTRVPVKIGPADIAEFQKGIA
jgi:beta-barrel assembly-enhancing protease